MNYRIPDPKFKVGESLRTWQEAKDNITGGISFVVKIDNGYYICNNETIPINHQDEYEYHTAFKYDEFGRTLNK